MKRKEFINNIRWFTVLWLIPFHAACMFRPADRGDFYIVALKGGTMLYEYIRLASMPWMMPMLFAVAGASAYYALKGRTMGEFAKERVFRLLIPLAIAMVSFSPLQGYVGALNHRVGHLSFWDFLKDFYTTTGNGYKGAFSFNSFWFIRFLFYMNVILFPAMAWFRTKGKKVEEFVEKIPLLAVVGLFIFPFEGYYTKPADLCFREYICYFVLGFLVLSSEAVQEKLSKRCWPLMGAAAVFSVCNVLLCLDGTPSGVGYIFFYRFLRWLCVVAAFGFFKRCFDRRCRVTDYLTKSSYAFYLLHEHTLLLTVYYVIRKLSFFRSADIHVIYLLSVGIATLATFASYEIIHRIPGLRLAVGERAKKKTKETE